MVTKVSRKAFGLIIRTRASGCKVPVMTLNSVDFLSSFLSLQPLLTNVNHNIMHSSTLCTTFTFLQVYLPVWPEAMATTNTSQAGLCLS